MSCAARWRSVKPGSIIYSLRCRISVSGIWLSLRCRILSFAFLPMATRLRGLCIPFKKLRGHESGTPTKSPFVAFFRLSGANSNSMGIPTLRTIPMAATKTNEKAHPNHVDAVVIGAGFAGLYAVYRLRRMGLSHAAFEQGGGVGGT